MDVLQSDRAAVRNHSAPAHVLAEGRQRELLGDLRLAHERPAPVLAHQVALADELVQGGPEREPRNAELAAQPTLGRDRGADTELGDERDHALPDLLLLRHPAPWKHTSRLMVKTTREAILRKFSELALDRPKWTMPISCSWPVD